MLDGEGVRTGVDLEALIEVTRWLARVMQITPPGLLHRAGPFVAKSPAVSVRGADAAADALWRGAGG